MGHLQVTKIYNEEKIYSARSLVAVHIVNFQRDLVVMRFIRIELISFSTGEVDTVKVHIHTFCITQYCAGDKIEKKMCWACGAYG